MFLKTKVLSWNLLESTSSQMCLPVTRPEQAGDQLFPESLPWQAAAPDTRHEVSGAFTRNTTPDTFYLIPDTRQSIVVWNTYKL